MPPRNVTRSAELDDHAEIHDAVGGVLRLAALEVVPPHLIAEAPLSRPQYVERQPGDRRLNRQPQPHRSIARDAGGSSRDAVGWHLRGRGRSQVRIRARTRYEGVFAPSAQSSVWGSSEPAHELELTGERSASG